MLIEILSRTPLWVFVLFFALLALGYFQSRSLTVSRGKVALLPGAMVVLSFYGVLSAFGWSPLGITLWGLGATAAAWGGVKLAMPKDVVFSPETHTLTLPGSWLPLALMMAIFFTKYAVGVVLARQLPVASTTAFVACVSLAYGLFSGVFLARVVVIRRAMQTP